MKKGLLSEILKRSDIPEEVVFDIPYITLSGELSVTLENHRGIIAYDEDCIKINTKSAIVKIEGEALCLSHITDEIISVSGKIKSLEFV